MDFQLLIINIKKKVFLDRVKQINMDSFGITFLRQFFFNKYSTTKRLMSRAFNINKILVLLLSIKKL